MSWSPELHIGELRPWPDSVRVVRGESLVASYYVPERTAKRVVVFSHDTDCATGDSKCSECGGTVNPFALFCEHCGARFEEGE